MKSLVCSFTTLCVIGNFLPAKGQELKEIRPNFVWFMAEDVSKHYLSLYNDGSYGAVTPNLEKLATEGIIFNNAYSNAPVSSAARTTLITGCYATRLGCSYHRRMEEVPLPKGVNMFPAYLRKAGYYTFNASKTDYNCILDETAWDVVGGKLCEWHNRPNKKKPFFLVRTNVLTHESNLLFPKSRLRETRTNNLPDNVFVHPYHPNTELFRYTYATFYDCIQDSDKELGKLMRMLEENGELDNTFIFYFGDNGGALPGTKGYTTEGGMQVPLVVYVPARWRDKIPLKIGTKVDGFVSFVDFGPTLLHLAGVDARQEMDGIPFLGTDISLKQLNERNEVYGYGDRFGELYAFNRTLRQGKFKYSRNFLSYHPKSLYSNYRYKQAAFCEWRELYEAGKLNAVQSRFFEPQKAEELYDLSIDPYETCNLADSSAHDSILKGLRKLLKSKMIGEHDLGLFPECEWLYYGKQSPTEFGLNSWTSIKKYSDIADLELGSFEEAETILRKVLNSTDPVERYWGVTVCAAFGDKASSLYDELDKLLNDSRGYVRSRAVIAMIRSQSRSVNVEDIMKQALLLSKSSAESLLILNDMTYLHDVLSYNFILRPTELLQSSNEIRNRLEYLNK